jgi:hypothetical protein
MRMWPISTRVNGKLAVAPMPAQALCESRFFEALIVPDLHVKTASRCARLPDRFVVGGSMIILARRCGLHRPSDKRGIVA